MTDIALGFGLLYSLIFDELRVQHTAVAGIDGSSLHLDVCTLIRRRVVAVAEQTEVLARVVCKLHDYTCFWID